MDRPWTIIDPAVPPRLPAMLGGEELQFLYWLGLESADAPLIDLGAFLGASAAAMAAGAERAGSSSQVHSYDLFTYGPWCEPYGMGEGWTDGADTQPWVRERIGRLSDRVVLHKGDICEQHWRGPPASALFVDFTQNWFHHNHVCRAFLPHLKLGSVLAHQDYVYVLCYWLHVFMEHYADHFEILSRWIMNGTAAWRYLDPLPQEAFSRGMNELLTFNQMLNLLERSIDRYEGIARGMLMLARARFFLHAKGQEAATAECEAVSRANTIPELEPHLSQLRDEILRWPRNGGAYEGFFRS